mmetsp:Transcript_28794/g.73929  ORF Transcript_28794/g.73929 Transcript_28794/m.73929 type:complete len:137 (+) Transcript_28794:144-554(+)
MSEELVLNTAPTSKRFPTTNQSKACYMFVLCRPPPQALRCTPALDQAPGSRRLRALHARGCLHQHPAPSVPSLRYYNSWHQCKYDYSEEEPQCAKLKGWAMSMCPIEWVEKWEAQRASGTYPGPVPGEKKDPGEGH